MIPLGPRKAGRKFRGGQRETHVTRLTTKRLLAKPWSISDLPGFLGPNGDILLLS